GIEDKIHAAGVFILVEDFLERLAAVERTEDATLGIRAIRMTLSRDEQPIGIFGIDDDGCDLLRVAQSRSILTKMLPCAARIGRLVDTVANGEIRSAQAFAAADINRVRIR